MRVSSGAMKVNTTETPEKPTAVVAVASSTGLRVTTRSSSRRLMAGACRLGSTRASDATEASVSTVSTANGARHPAACPSSDPRGTPSKVATVNPEATVAIAEPVLCSGTTLVAITRASARNAAWLSEETTRPASSSANVGARALSALPAANSSIRPIASPLRGSRAVAMVTRGPPITTPSA